MKNQSHVHTEYMGYILATDYTEALFCYMQIKLEGDLESLYWFGTPVPHRYWCFLATRNKTCLL